jgi:chromosome segregation ATPase
MDIPALTQELEMIWQQIHGLHRQATETMGGQEARLVEALAQLATALGTLQTTQEARRQAYEAAGAQGAAQRRKLADANARLRAEVTTRTQALVRASQALTAAWAARRRAEEVRAALTEQVQVTADQLAITGEQLQTRTAELLMALQEIEALNAELLAMNAELLALNTELLGQLERGGETGTA